MRVVSNDDVNMWHRQEDVPPVELPLRGAAALRGTMICKRWKYNYIRTWLNN